MQAVILFPDISPELFSIQLGGFEFALRWYALSYIVGIILSWRYGIAALRRADLWPGQKAPMTPAQLDDLLTWIIIGIILGGRLGFVLFYQPAYYFANPSEILMLWNGGMAFHGGLLGVVLAILVYTRRHKIPILGSADMIALTVPVSIFLVRLANFVNAELWGRPTDVPWAVAFPGAAAQNCPDVIGLCARHPSQIYEALLEGVVLGLVLFWLAYRRGAFSKPGFVTGAFLAGYALARIVVEFFRQPDAQFVSPGNPLGLAYHFNGYGVTMGQTLSLPMLALGLWLIWRAKKATT